MNEYQRLQKIYRSIRGKIPFQPSIALTLGSGLGDYADGIEIASVIDYHDIEGFPVSTAPGHKGRFVFGHVNGVPVVVMQGRIHYYEGYAIRDVVLPTRLMGMMGAQVLLLTNAAGGVNPDYQSGDFMLIRDQIADFVPSPLIGENIAAFGPRFPDMSDLYDARLREVIRNTAVSLGINLREGVYIQLTGPNYETPAEVHMCRLLGADAVGMSTGCEAVAAHHMGMRVCGISCISNLGAGMTDRPLTAEEVEETAARVAPLFRQLITASIVHVARHIGE